MGQIIKPSVPKGSRDFSPVVMRKRNYLFDVIKAKFEQFGYDPIETPAMEKLTTLTGKYGEEGDRLIFKVLNSGDFLAKSDQEAIKDNNSGKFARSISEKALRYDLTVPFARYVVQHQNDITFPFKRYQMQAVWRADRPQKGRYREFYQCDADVIGSTSLLNEAELIHLMAAVFDQLKLPVTIKINNRKILKGIVEVIGLADRFSQVVIIIDKLAKIGQEKVGEELTKIGITPPALEQLNKLINFSGSIADKLRFLREFLKGNEIGMKGVDELTTTLGHVLNPVMEAGVVEFDIVLARGLDYYTGAIFEVIAKDVQMGSISGGGRYDDLTGIFGLKGTSGVGISFGIDRIYDVMEELNLFDGVSESAVQLLFVNFGEEGLRYAQETVSKLREKEVKVEIYPDHINVGKQLKYANAKGIEFVALAGSEEIKEQVFTLKNMKTGEQTQVNLDHLLNTVVRK